MELLAGLIDIFLHLDRHLDEIFRNYGAWTYAILFLIIFAETGFVVTPFLPGDSLLFGVGALSARGSLDPSILVVVLSVAAILGDTANYWIGFSLGPKVFHYQKSRIFRREYLDRTHRFYEKYGGRTIIIARFVPIIRTFAPFVAGIGRMGYGRFMSYNVFGGIGWVCIFVGAGHYFGNIPTVRKNFTWVILAIIVISAVPVVIEILRARRGTKRQGAPSTPLRASKERDPDPQKTE